MKYALPLALALSVVAPVAALDHPTDRRWITDAGRAGERAAPALFAGSADEALAALRARLPAGVELVERKTDGGPHRVFEQRAGGSRVARGTLTLTWGPHTALITGQIATRGNLAGAYALSTTAARARAFAHAGVRRPAAPARVESVLWSTPSGLRRAYEVAFTTAVPPSDARIVVDARTGAVLHADDLAGALDGKAAVYRTHPLDGEPVVQPIAHLTDGSHLKGDFVAVENSAGMEADGTDGAFVYPAGSPHLDEANVYYHLERVHAFLRDHLGYTGLESPLAAAVHYGENLDNAYYVPWGHYIVFGDGGRYNVLSRDASVAYHEYTHAMTNRIAGLGSVGAAAALSEGYSDYVAATLQDDPRIAVWTVAKLGKPYLRTVDNRLHKPEDLQNESHHDSQIWSGLLWDLRKALGAAVADALAYRSIYSLNSEASMEDAAKALEVADDALSNGAHRATIHAAAAARGL